MTAERVVLQAPPAGPSRTGLFVTLEGGEAVGKSTQLRLLREHLESERGIDPARILATREPGGTALGQRLRELILHGGEVDLRAEALLYAADRAHHVATVVRPHLEAGGIVLADRYLDSSIAYQGAGRQLDAAQVRALSLWATDGLLPHRTLLLDADSAVIGQRRETESLDRLERAGLAFHRAVREQFIQLAASDPERWRRLDASALPEQVHAQVLSALAPDLEEWERAQ